MLHYWHESGHTTRVIALYAFIVLAGASQERGADWAKKLIVAQRNSYNRDCNRPAVNTLSTWRFLMSTYWLVAPQLACYMFPKIPGCSSAQNYLPAASWPKPIVVSCFLEVLRANRATVLCWLLQQQISTSDSTDDAWICIPPFSKRPESHSGYSSAIKMTAVKFSGTLLVWLIWAYTFIGKAAYGHAIPQRI